MAMETLLTAIAIIKQSKVFGDERCQALVTSLKDCLVSIQGNYGYRSVNVMMCQDSQDMMDLVVYAKSGISCFFLSVCFMQK